MREFILCLQTRTFPCRPNNKRRHFSSSAFFRIYVLHQNWDPYQIPFRKFDTYMPYKVPSKIRSLSSFPPLTTLSSRLSSFSCTQPGFAQGEVRHLRYEDISRSQGRIHVQGGKSRCDRYAVLSDQVLNCSLLITGSLSVGHATICFHHLKRGDGKEVPVQSVHVLKKSENTKIFLVWEHKITAHTFQHAFAMHLLQKWCGSSDYQGSLSGIALLIFNYDLHSSY